MNDSLLKEFEYYLANQDDLVAKFDGMFVVIKKQKVLGAYSDELEAVNETKKDHKAGSFLIQLVSPGNAEYTQTFHSRVAFS